MYFALLQSKPFCNWTSNCLCQSCKLYITQTSKKVIEQILYISVWIMYSFINKIDYAHSYARAAYTMPVGRILTIDALISCYQI